MNPDQFILFGAAHWAIFGVMAVVITALIFVVKRFPSAARWINYALAAILVLNKIVTVYVAQNLGILTLQDGLPMHLCDWASITTIIVLLWRNQLLYELSYYWGLSGTIQAVLTPELNVALSDPRFYTFFISHCGIIIAVFYLTIGLRMKPTKFSVWKVFGITQIYLVVTMGLDRLIGANYGYFLAKPRNPSILDYLGPWPWYILAEEVIALVFFALCYLPFQLRWKPETRNSKPE